MWYKVWFKLPKKEKRHWEMVFEASIKLAIINSDIPIDWIVKVEACPKYEEKFEPMPKEGDWEYIGEAKRIEI